jgi:glycosyltransferase involved in cell wall biosynthesis
MRLTVAIPTYNRNEVLRESLTHLLPQLGDECELLILDNHSDVPVEVGLGDLLARYPRLRWRVVRHNANLGSAANILRCFELCETEWMWLLSDDDHPARDAVATVLAQLTAHPECTSLHFASNAYRREEGFLATGLRELVFRVDSWSHLLFMSVGVFNCRLLRPHLRMGYYFAYSLSPHVSLVLSALGEGGSCYFPKDEIVVRQAPAEWSAIRAILGKATLLELPMDDDVRRELARKMRSRPSLEATVMILLASARASRDIRLALFQYDQICSRVYYFDRGWLLGLRIHAYRLLIRVSPIACPVLQWLLRVFRKKPASCVAPPTLAAMPDGFQRL